MQNNIIKVVIEEIKPTVGKVGRLINPLPSEINFSNHQTYSTKTNFTFHFNTVSILSTTIGLVTGWTSPYMAQLTSPTSELPITSAQASWVVSLLPLGRFLGAIIGSVLVEFLGSKKTLLLTGLPLVPGWIFIICANSAYWLYISRLMSGISMGMIFTCFALYIGEIANPKIRGALIGCVINGMPLGTLLGNTLGPYLSMTWFSIIGLILNISFLVLFFFIPRSPHYFIKNNMPKKAAQSVAWYHRNSDPNEELASIKRLIEASQQTSLKSKLKEMNQPKNRRAFLITTLLFFFMQISGMNAIVYYMEIIVRNARVTSIAPSTVVIIVSIIGITFAWIAVYTIDQCGRRLLLSISNAGVVVGTTLLGVHYMLLHLEYDPAPLQWLPIFSLITFMLMCIGLVPVPSTILGELFPSNLKSVAGCITSAFSALVAFVSSKAYQPLVDLTAEEYVFWMHSGIMFCSLVFGLVWLPETKGKSLQEIQDMLVKETGRTERDEEVGVSGERQIQNK